MKILRILFKKFCEFPPRRVKYVDFTPLLYSGHRLLVSQIIELDAYCYQIFSPHSDCSDTNWQYLLSILLFSFMLALFSSVLSKTIF
jgi:hypothetical protein